MMTMWMRRVRLIGAVALGVTCVQVFGPEAGGTARRGGGAGRGAGRAGVRERGEDGLVASTR